LALVALEVQAQAMRVAMAATPLSQVNLTL
jgi:hypothetical protein